MARVASREKEGNITLTEREAEELREELRMTRVENRRLAEELEDESLRKEEIRKAPPKEVRTFPEAPKRQGKKERKKRNKKRKKARDRLIRKEEEKRAQEGRRGIAAKDLLEAGLDSALRWALLPGQGPAEMWSQVVGRKEKQKRKEEARTSGPSGTDLEGEKSGELPALTSAVIQEDQPPSQLDWEPETAEGTHGWKEEPPVAAGRKRKDKEDPEPMTEDTEQEDIKVRGVEPTGPPPTIVEEGEMERTLPPSLQLADSSSYSREEEIVQVGTPHYSAEVPADEATTAETSPRESKTALPLQDCQGEVEVGSPEEACKA
ncbi:hypothetical protein EAI_15977 [Harpegnathos saltator]|uniref:Uncharacterized protein n=1 Tax=Harpegnathos saltator TaxID=610380 RepID=E2BCY1_HARSA|nr:hypothetical protein EAI_15977 [Harpegnathos saltator]